jgi:hypothetical protein
MPDAEKLATLPTVAELAEVTRLVQEAWDSVDNVLVRLHQVTRGWIGDRDERQEPALTYETIGAFWSFAVMLTSYGIDLREAARCLTNGVDGFVLDLDAQQLLERV